VVALTGRFLGKQVNKLMEWRRADQAEVQALLDFFILVSVTKEQMLLKAVHT
jgi:hypothetical protein